MGLLGAGWVAGWLTFLTHTHTVRACAPSRLLCARDASASWTNVAALEAYIQRLQAAATELTTRANKNDPLLFGCLLSILYSRYEERCQDRPERHTTTQKRKAHHKDCLSVCSHREPQASCGPRHSHREDNRAVQVRATAAAAAAAATAAMRLGSEEANAL